MLFTILAMLTHDSPSYEEVMEERKKFLALFREYWLDHAFLTWQWWSLLITTILFWILWWKFVDKTRTQLILNFGLIVAIISLILDMIGINHVAWSYPIRLYWAFIPPLLPFDLTYVPVSFMLVYQRCGNTLGSFLIAFAIVSAFFSFVIEPFLNLIGVYKTYTWKYVYSFPVYILTACISKFLVHILSSHSKN